MRDDFLIRLATDNDIASLEALIAISTRALMAPCYSPAQIEAAIGLVFGVDHQLIQDRTYFVAEHGEQSSAAAAGASVRHFLVAMP
jgi:hypothetical protein